MRHERSTLMSWRKERLVNWIMLLEYRIEELRRYTDEKDKSAGSNE